MIADVFLHYGMKGDSYNLHAHVLLTIRDINEKGFGKKNVEWNSREFSKKDQIYFLRNDNDLGVKNGTLGEVISVNKKRDIEVNIKGGEKDRKVSFK